MKKLTWTGIVLFSMAFGLLIVFIINIIYSNAFKIHLNSWNVDLYNIFFILLNISLFILNRGFHQNEYKKIPTQILEKAFLTITWVTAISYPLWIALIQYTRNPLSDYPFFHYETWDFISGIAIIILLSLSITQVVYFSSNIYMYIKKNQ